MDGQDSRGWQIELHLMPITATKWLVSDCGRTLGLLDDAGKSIAAAATKDWVDTQARFYGFKREGLVLQKVTPYPFDPVDLQVFAEGIAALTHAAPRQQAVAALNTARVIEDRIGNYFYRRHREPKRNFKLNGSIESAIAVDYYLEDKRPLALQAVSRSSNLRPYMEQWAWRWTDLRNAHPNLIEAMVFDPDNQAWDNEALKLGERVCDIFVPYYEAEDALDARLVA